ncbi:helix-turn-helix domain-containing protein [Paenibacillus lautus]|uniref:helix-turn-helix domain-containing protein n=1 Tax=Paenibacillus lautus TaxID=1401 RepID=UPI003D2DF84A
MTNLKLHIDYPHDIPIDAFQWTPETTLEPFHTHTSLEIGCCISGSGVFYFEQKCYTVRPGDIFIVNQTELHIAQSDEVDPSTFIFINFDPSILLLEDEKLLLPYSYQSEKFQNHIPAETSLACQLQPRIMTIHEELSQQDVGYLSRARSILIDISVLLLRNYIGSISSEQWRRMNHSYRELRQMLEFVHRHFGSNIQLADVAQTVGWSQARTSRLFREYTGKSLRDYLAQLRLSEVKKRLVTTDDLIANICFDCGFQSMASFYRAFHANTGTSPKEYREMNGLSEDFEKLGDANEKSK